jgi:hypothetical protein
VFPKEAPLSGRVIVFFQQESKCMHNEVWNFTEILGAFHLSGTEISSEFLVEWKAPINTMESQLKT